MATLPEIRVNASAAIRRETIGDDINCVVVDDFLLDPHSIVEFAARHAGEFKMADSDYPGFLRSVSDDAMSDIYRYIRSAMTKHFPFLRGGMDLWTYLSMVTLQPNELSNLQRSCHTDPNKSPDRRIYAGLVYLFENDSLGGTGFYRWKARDLMRKAAAIGHEDPEKALQFLREHFATYREPARYMTRSNEIAELVCTIPAQFNRMIFYSGEVPHSGAITAPELLSTDFRSGRLTLNIFASVLPR